MKFVLYFCYLSIVWIIAFTGCGMKHNENIPHDSIHLQAKTDAELDASHDANTLAYLGAGVSVPFAAAPCGVTYAFMTAPTEYLGGIIALAGSAAVLSLLIAHHSRPPNPPPERLIGKSPEYVKFYAKIYRSKMRSHRMRAVAAGSIVGCAAITVMSAIIISNL